MEQNTIQTDKASTYEEDSKSKNELNNYKNCFSCDFLRVDSDNELICIRRKNEDVIYKLDKDKVSLPCPVRDAMVWDEWIDENGDFKVDNECGYGYQRWLKKMEERVY